MTPTRWQEIERVYHAALERPPTTRDEFLTEACKNDSELRREVESLLADDLSKTGTLDQPAWVGLDGLTALDATVTVMPPGAKLGPYKIEGPLGKGGMGEVYRARDTKLKREVAIKILPDEFSRDPDRVSRFQREAEVLASLNHPNIAAIHSFEEANGARFLVLELVAGETLAERIKRGPIPVDRALTISKQICEALEAAHEKGVVHRDLKPANVKITPDGVVKVLDFGLAKVVAGGASAPDLTQVPTLMSGGTAEGVILGTAAYMSPEQARGRPVDKRTDIWAFGCVFYEILTGQPAFARDTITDTLAAIVEREPDWSALPQSTPPTIKRLLRRCLDKDQKRRLRDIGDARSEIDEALAEWQAVAVSQPTMRRSKSRLTLAATVLLAAAVVSAAYLPRLFAPEGQREPGDMKVDQFTRDSGLTTAPTLSADGRLIAYASDRAGHGDLDIWVQQTTRGVPLQLTTDEADDYMPDFSSDGSQIAFRSERGTGGVYIVPALGGDTRFVASDGRWPRFSPDGRRVAYWTGQWRGTPSALASASFVLSLDGGTPRPILPEFKMARDPRWAPDGRSLLVLARRDASSPLAQTFDWWWVHLDGQPPIKTGILDLLDLRKETDAEVVTVGPWAESGLMISVRGSLWSVPVSPESGQVSGAPRQLTFGAGLYEYPAASRDGQIVRTIERVPLANQTEPPTTLYSEAGSGASRPSQTSDGSTVLFVKATSQFNEIWIRNTRSDEQRMVLRTEGTLGGPTLSPDASRIGYTLEKQPDIGTGFIVDAAGGVPRRVCDDCGVHGFLSDNRHILVVAKALHEIHLIDVMTGSAEKLLEIHEGEVDRPHVSPNDRWLAFRHVVGTTAKVFVAPLVPGHPPNADSWARVEEPTTTPRPAGWSPDSRMLYLLLDTDGFRCLWGQRVDPASGHLVGAPYPVRHFHSTAVKQFSNSYGNAFATDSFLYGGSRTTSNVWRLVMPKGL